MTSADKVRLFRSLFRGRPDIYPTRFLSKPLSDSVILGEDFNRCEKFEAVRRPKPPESGKGCLRRRCPKSGRSYRERSSSTAANAPDSAYVGRLESRPASLCSGLRRQRTKLASWRRSYPLEDDDVTVPHDYELGAGFQTERLADILRDDDLTLR
jgi:hypothetical protein